MKIALAILLFTLVVIPKAHAAPLNKQPVQESTPEVKSVQKQVQPQEPVKVEAQPTAAPVEEQPPVAITAAVETPPSQPIACGDNVYANYIYMHESNCSTTAVNSIGCRGLGQSCPGDKLPCGDDYDCQNKWFSNYAIQRYGSWEQAYYFWLGNHWW